MTPLNGKLSLVVFTRWRLPITLAFSQAVFSGSTFGSDQVTPGLTPDPTGR
ncbi:MAG: hypothetical protein VKK42_13425 [Lyngbya sp.]|nr:hypothetical protein [Lyngbya sp.]